MDKHELTKFEGRIKELIGSLNMLAQGEDGDLRELLRIIHQPGWTTPAELVFSHGIVDSMLVQTKALVGLKQVLLQGSRAVPQAAPGR
jgi:hypothetical protein